jgi:hypothetical protein
MGKDLLNTDEDFVFNKRFGNSVKKLENRYPDGCPIHIIANALNISQEEVVAEYQRVVLKLRALMGVDSL